MLKNISNLGTTLSKEEQKDINGGFFGFGNRCSRNSDCYGQFLGPGDVFCTGSIFNPGSCQFY